MRDQTSSIAGLQGFSSLFNFKSPEANSAGSFPTQESVHDREEAMTMSQIQICGRCSCWGEGYVAALFVFCPVSTLEILCLHRRLMVQVRAQMQK